MGLDIFEISINILKIVLIFLLMVQLVPVLVWVERRGSAFIQNRLGPNRVGPLGLTQLLADAVKFIFKEEFSPAQSRKLIFYGAPVVALIPGALAFGAIPLSFPVAIEQFQDFFGNTWGPYNFLFQSYKIGAGIIFVLGVSSLGAFSLLMAGWGSGNKYSMMGALRATAQMISYELALGLSIVGALLIYNTFDFTEIISAQTGMLSLTLSDKSIPLFLPNWGIFYQPIGAFLFFVSVLAETNRLPFDLPEAESELVAGFHTEYGGLKMLMFYIGEYGHMMVASALLIVFYFGGYNLPYLSPEELKSTISSFLGYSHNVTALITSTLLFTIMLLKILTLLWFFIWIRWTLPRFRYDQLMDLGWKTMLPWALGNTIVTALLVYFFHQVG